MCNIEGHDVEYICSKKSSQPHTETLTSFVRIDIFYCEKCQDLRTKDRSIVSKERPTWY